MASVLGLVSGLQKYFRFDKYDIDNNVFRLHYKATVMVFACASLLVTSAQFFGDPIQCHFDSAPKGSSGKLLNTFCWIQSTYTVFNKYQVGKIGEDFPHPGVGPVSSDAELKFHRWYQWVAFFLTFQAILFYIPRYLWKSCEGQHIQMLIQDLQQPLMSAADKKDQMKNLATYFLTHRGFHSSYALKFFALELLNLVNVLGQMYFIDVFLDGEFSTYGMDVWNFTGNEYETRPDPMAAIFPKVTKCTFHKYGVSGSIEKFDGLCVLPLNIIIEKIFIFVWFWLVGLALLTGHYIIFRLFTIMSSKLRILLIKWRGGRSCHQKDIGLILDPPCLTWKEKLNFMQKLGDWYLLESICKNLHTLLVNDLIFRLSQAYKMEHYEDGSNSETLRVLKRSPYKSLREQMHELDLMGHDSKL